MASGDEWLTNFRQLCQVDAVDFSDAWERYDEDGR